MMSKLYTQSPITDIEPIYTLFTIFQYNLLNKIKESKIINKILIGTI